MTAGREDPLRASARARGEAPALVTRHATWSYRRLDAAADRVARLVTDGISPRAADPRTPAGDGQLALSAPSGGVLTPGAPTVAALLPRGAHGVAALHGVPRTGAAVAPLHPGWTEPELSAWLRRLRPDVLLCVGRTRDRAAAIVPAGTKLVRLPATGDLFEAGADRPADPPEARPGAVHTVIATSGTSGRPRAVPLTLANHLASARGAIDRLELRPDDRWLATLSSAHVGGVAMAVRAAVLGCVLVLRASFDAEELLELAEADEVTHVSLVPVMLRRVLEATRGRAPRGLRCLLVGGDAADPDLVLRAHGAGLPVALTYGLTEAASQVATAPPERARRKPESVGRPLPGVEVRISEEDEILVRGPTVASDTATLDAATIGATSDGWLPTGDAGRLDDEGDLHVIGRLSARIVTGGVTVDPAEVERVLRSHPGVRDAAVIGLPDEEWGERVAAAIEADAPGGAEAPEGLEAFCRERLAGPKLPRCRAFVGRLPRNPNGKVDRDGVRALFPGG